MDYSLYVVVEHLKYPLAQQFRSNILESDKSISIAGTSQISRSINQQSLAAATSINSHSFKTKKSTLKKLKANEFGRNVFVSKDRKMVYHIAVIDYLQEWNLSKKVERFYK